ncbi:MAG: phosphoribosylaminoimidazolesuccinocarboxamide synthase [Candidatus Eisenbacteria bacterium]|nr:phosphoribosylaminoimidazolesuccinocarboxamide synthase [Candidatus Eisenbacteria bacterium]
MNENVSQGLKTLLDVGLAPSFRGKVREMLDMGSELIMVATDRISAFDAVLPTVIPDKGRILTSISTYWLKGLGTIMPTHFMTADLEDLPEPLRRYEAILDGRWMLVRKAKPIPVECIVRGYLTGSGWREYEKNGTIGGIPLPSGLTNFGPLPEPIFTPSTKSHEGHDVNISLEQLRDEVGQDLARKLEYLSLELFRRAASHAESCGLILADTKFEFGWIDNKIHLIDEAFTPDSSRWWPAETVGTGHAPKSLDKEYVRRHLKSLPWSGEPPAPELAPDIVAETLERYRDVERRLRESGDVPDLGQPLSAS